MLSHDHQADDQVAINLEAAAMDEFRRQSIAPTSAGVVAAEAEQDVQVPHFNGRSRNRELLKNQFSSE